MGKGRKRGESTFVSLPIGRCWADPHVATGRSAYLQASLVRAKDSEYHQVPLIGW